MSGITSYGAYVPLHRISRSTIGQAWGSSQPKGERAVAYFDEDSLTMAVAAAIDCLDGIDRQTVDGLFLATTTAPYKEKQSAALIAAVLGLPREALTTDFSGSLRCGSNAIKAAMNAVDSGAAKNVLVCASDMRLGYPSGPSEMAFGDGAAAFLVSNNNVIAEISSSFTWYQEIQDIWRADADCFVRSAEDRFSTEEGYVRVVTEFLKDCLQKTVLAPRDFTRIVMNSANPRHLNTVVRNLKLSAEQIVEVLHESVGDTGSANGLMNLAAALDGAKEGEKILVSNYGNGCDAFVLEITGQVSNYSNKRSISEYINSKKMVSEYTKYLKWRDLIEVQPPARPPIEARQPSPAAQWREIPWELRLTGTKCENCGTPQYPPQRVCITCHTKDRFTPYSFTDKSAKVFSFSHDYVMQTLDPPVTVTFVDYEGGGRLMCEMTDRDPDSIHVDMPVEMTFRKLYTIGGVHNYWWKCQPLRIQPEQ